MIHNVNRYQVTQKVESTLENSGFNGDWLCLLQIFYQETQEHKGKYISHFTIFNMIKHDILGFITRGMAVEMLTSVDTIVKARLHFNQTVILWDMETGSNLLT